MLLGSGQEIYIGEEDGEAYIQKAIEHIKGLRLPLEVGIHLFVPTQEMADTYGYLGHSCEVKTGLLLEQNKRNAYNDSALEFVNMIIDGSTPLLGDDLKDAFYVFNDYENMKKALEPINTGAFSIGLVANGFDTLTEWVPDGYGNNKPVSYLKLSGEKIRNISNEELKAFYINKTSNEMKTFASQFNCQGLEFDYTVMIWGNMMLRRNNRWELSSQTIAAIDKYCKELSEIVTRYKLTGITVDKAELKDTFVRNCYRVLLTRARIATYIFIEDDETYKYIKTVIRD